MIRADSARRTSELVHRKDEERGSHVENFYVRGLTVAKLECYSNGIAALRASQAKFLFQEFVDYLRAGLAAR